MAAQQAVVLRHRLAVEKSVSSDPRLTPITLCQRQPVAAPLLMVSANRLHQL